MFKELKNEFKLNFKLKVDSPLCIQSGEDSIDPTLPDMQCIRSYKGGKNVVFIPGSSLKGVIRSRCEKIFNIIAGEQRCCNITEGNKAQCNKESGNDGKEVYYKLCPACKMFGSMALGGRFKFKDAYPENGEFKTGYRNSISVNRITGATSKGAKYDFEVVEDGTFDVTITGENFELYQLKVLLWAMQDINDGYVTFGYAGTRGNGKMLVEDMELNIRDFRQTRPTRLTGYNNECGAPLEYIEKNYYFEGKIVGKDNILNSIDGVSMPSKF